MTPRWLMRLWCAYAGHQTVMVIDDADLRDADHFGARFDITRSHYRCRRCLADPI